MITEDGTRLQESLRRNPAVEEVMACNSVMLGIIQAAGTFYSDNGQNPSGATLVNISLQNGWPDIYRVPVLSPKMNRKNGVSIDPEPGDQVVVAFINGKFSNPVVVGFLPPQLNGIQPTSADGPLYHTHWQGTDIKLKKDGTRQVHIEKDDVLEVVGDGTVVIGGNLTIQASSITIKGNTTLEGNLTVTGNIHANGTMSDSHGTSPWPD